MDSLKALLFKFITLLSLCWLLWCNAAKINEETGDDLDDNVMFDDVDGEEDDIDDVSLLL